MATNVNLIPSSAASISVPSGRGAQLVVDVGVTTIVDHPSAARTASGNTSTIADDQGTGLAFTVNVTAVSGTSPTLDLVLQESHDGGATWNDVYHVERITGTGTVNVSPLMVMGVRRWAWTITGTTPSFTFTITSASTSMPVPRHKSIFDRSLNAAQALNAVTAVLPIINAKSVSITVSSGPATTPCVISLQYSLDKVNWYGAGVAITSAANTTNTTNPALNYGARYVRGIVTTAGAGQTLNWINLSSNP